MPDVQYQVRDHVAEIALQRAPVNALTEGMLDQLIAVLTQASIDPNVRAVILHSALTQRFCAGIDLKAVEQGSEVDLRTLIEKLYVGVFDAQLALGKPSIAVVNGATRGGGMTLAISCDLVVAARSATFGYPEIDVGLIPAIHFAHLPGIVGRYRAFDLLFSGRTFSADEAAVLGLVSRVVEDEGVLDEARALARALADKPEEALRRGRAMFRRVNDADYRPKVLAAVNDFCAVASTPQAREAVKAFLNKRTRAGS